MWFGTLLYDYDTFAATLRRKYAPPVGALLPENIPGYRARHPIPEALRVAPAYYGVVDDDDTSNFPMIINAQLSQFDDNEPESELAMSQSSLVTTIDHLHLNSQYLISVVPPNCKTFHISQKEPRMPTFNLNNHKLTQIAHRSSRFSWC